ncbi:hypothetical protein BST81_18180 [Leptolyngbya sp. 'hensonii']|uniref:hypothetical protein n=1 Tax=Leptolyngbya sp. 'hensonii' TaxID=1922337 RepID=UPI00094F74DB|nr:hypothetical protein [Leptolyngbya sp. 'hensonii']OLP16921.1 hypothetical protein BST81_18180 [Leptolyngbya sp. 'hensonii']
MALKDTADQSRTRLLLALWELGTAGTEIKKGDLSKKVVRTGEKSGDYQGFLDELNQKGAIAFPARGKISISAPQQIQELLRVGLGDESFTFKAQIGKNTANALLQLIRGMGTVAPMATQAATIDSYEAFKPAALEVYDRLNRDFNLNNLVPIYRLRREIGDRVTRTHFDEWLLEMQSKDIFQLIGGEMPELTSDKTEDSIKTALGAMRYYAKRI